MTDKGSLNVLVMMHLVKPMAATQSKQRMATSLLVQCRTCSYGGVTDKGLIECFGNDVSGQTNAHPQATDDNMDYLVRINMVERAAKFVVSVQDMNIRVV